MRIAIAAGEVNGMFFMVGDISSPLKKCVSSLVLNFDCLLDTF
jgi:hypothetical protein